MDDKPSGAREADFTVVGARPIRRVEVVNRAGDDAERSDEEERRT
jgi:hypothetical protein